MMIKLPAGTSRIGPCRPRPLGGSSRLSYEENFIQLVGKLRHFGIFNVVFSAEAGWIAPDRPRPGGGPLSYGLLCAERFLFAHAMPGAKGARPGRGVSFDRIDGWRSVRGGFSGCGEGIFEILSTVGAVFFSIDLISTFLSDSGGGAFSLHIYSSDLSTVAGKAGSILPLELEIHAV
jgi:hypothetical protein